MIDGAARVNGVMRMNYELERSQRPLNKERIHPEMGRLTSYFGSTVTSYGILEFVAWLIDLVSTVAPERG
jgi:hypothetical protein